MQRQLHLGLLSKVDIERIHEYTLEIFQKNGITFSGRALDLFKKHGFSVKGKQVYFTREEVDKALSLCPKSFTFKGRDKKYDFVIGDGKTLGVPGPVGPVNVSCLDKGKRPGTLNDISNFTKIYQQSDVINVTSNTVTEASDIDMSERYLKVQLEVLKHSTKPTITKILNWGKINHVLDMMEISLGGMEALKKGTYFAIGSAPSLSPLAWENDTTDCLIACAMRGQMVSVGTGLTTGITAPQRIYGTLVMQNAELLAGIILTQLVNPGNPVVYGTGGMPGNMRGAKYNCGSPSRILLQTGTIEIGKYYQLPTRTLTYGTEATNIDIQCGIESYEGTFASIVSGADYMLSEIGTLDGLFTTSYEKTIIDEEITARLIHLRNGIDTSDDAASMEVIYEVGSGGEYLTTEDTLDNYGDDFYASITDWNISGGTQDFDYVLKRANKEWKCRLEEAPETMLDAQIEKDLIRYIENV